MLAAVLVLAKVLVNSVLILVQRLPVLLEIVLRVLRPEPQPQHTHAYVGVPVLVGGEVWTATSMYI